MTRILHVANFNSLRLKGCFQCGFPVKISYGLIKNGFEVINYPDRDLCRMFGFGHMNALGRHRLNKHLLKFCRTVRPDAVLFGHADTITNETIAQIRRLLPGVRLMQWNCDSIADTDECRRNVKTIKERAEVVDVTMISTGEETLLQQFALKGKPVAHLPNMVDPAIEVGKTFAKRDLPYDAFLCANTDCREFCGKHREVEEILTLTENKIPGIRWLLGNLRGQPSLNGADYLDAFGKAGIGFSFSRYNNIKLYASDRLAHIVGNGELALIEREAGFNEFLSEDGAAFFSSEEEMIDKLAFYKNNPEARMKAAQIGHEAYFREFNNTVVTAFMAELLFGTFKQAARPWQVVVEEN